MWNIFAVILMLLLISSEVYSLQCHECNTASGQDCGVEYRAYKDQAVNCHLTRNQADNTTVCYTLYLSVLGHVMVDRGCSTSGNSTCDELNKQLISAGWVLDDVSSFCEVCSEDACNAITLQATTPKPNSGTSVAQTCVLILTLLVAQVITTW